MRSPWLIAPLLALHALPAMAESGFVADPKTGCRIRAANPNPKLTISWSGPCVDGLADGDGTLKSFNGGALELEYTGTVKKGVLDGRGRITFAGGETYEGDIRDGALDGRAVYTWPNGDRYEGDYRQGRRTGKGKITFGAKSRWPGDVYEGEFADGHFQGTGTYTWHANRYAGNVYTGQWRGDRMNGRGTLTLANGDRYEGEFRDNLADGKGVYTAKDGTKYEGTFKRGKSEDGKIEIQGP